MNDELYMRLALELAAAAEGQTGINPVVGCVVVKDGRIVGMGAHLQRGSAHAEVHALNMAGDAAVGSTVYVTLEPCSIHGRTPPCCERLLQEKVRRVVVARVDPNPRVAGSGIRQLREAGLEVTVGVLEREAAEQNERYDKFIRTRLPYVTLKTASTLDGRIASRTGDSKWITSEEARAFVHLLRHRHQAIMVGVGTVLADDPQLTTRLPVPGLQPVRIVVDSQLRTPEEARVLDGEAPTLLLTTAAAPAEKRQRLEQRGVEVVDAGNGPQVDLRAAMKLLGERELGSVLLEGGGILNGAMLEAGLIDKCYLFIAPKLIGGFQAPTAFAWRGRERMADAILLERMKAEMVGPDLCLSGYPRLVGEGS